MTHEDRGHYAGKHKEAVIDETLRPLIMDAANDGKITCSSLHRIARAQNIPPGQVGIQADLLELRLIECQLGLFGHGSKGKLLDPEIKIPPELEARLDEAVEDGRVSCLSCWEIARELKMKRLDVANACEKKEYRIKPCQLGAF